MILKTMASTCAILIYCGSIAAQTTLSEKRYGSTYFFSTPDYLTRTYQLNDDADLQLQNTAKETYAFIILEPKQMFDDLGAKLDGPQDYFDLVARSLSTTGSEFGEVKSLQINGHSALQCEIIAPFEDEKIAYLLTVVETRQLYCHILCWTPVETKDRYFPDFQKMAGSFRTDY